MNNSKTLANITIFEQQIKAAETIIKSLLDNKNPLLIAQMQQGKSGTLMYAIHLFISYCNLNNFSFKVYWVNCISDNELKQQVESQLAEAELSNLVTILHHANLKKEQTDKSNYDRILVVADECHYALEKSLPNELKPLFEFFNTKLGIKYGHAHEEWPNKNAWVISCSATPFAQNCLAIADSEKFESVILELSEEYFSLEDASNNGRLIQVEKCYDDKKDEITAFFKKRLDDFVAICKPDNEGPGHMVVRLFGNQCEKIKHYIEDHYQELNVEIFDCKIGNINQLDNTISCPVTKPQVNIIKQAFRAGKRLGNTRYIRMVIESPNSKSDTMAQAVGRYMGFPCKNGHSKFNDVFEIYCNMNEITDVMTYFRNQMTIPRGNRNNKPFIVGDNSIVKNKEWQYIPLSELPIDSKINFTEKLSTMKKNNPEELKDVLGEFLYGKSLSTLSRGGGNLIYLDSIPQHAEENLKNEIKKSWKQLEQTYPQYTKKLNSGKMCLFKKEVMQTNEDAVEVIKKNTMGLEN